jgi:hypothetical protein
MREKGSVPEKPPFNAVTRDYARLAFGLERHIPGFIDGSARPTRGRRSIPTRRLHRTPWSLPPAMCSPASR